MPNNKNNSRREEDIRREISASLTELKDERLSGKVTVTRCELTSDLSYCKIYFSYYGDEKNKAEALPLLEKASGFFKKNINARIKMRKIPELIFKTDDSLDYYDRISSILDDIKLKSDN
ncbi:ribosome-binding factor A [Clostridia bacterium]|nr:ribosome-binding factor A [Clostridia bacterium]